jgi:hypothetical protein
MSLRIVGAGLGRTGTHSLKDALEQLLGGQCYHMTELFQRPADTRVWQTAAAGEPVLWSEFLHEFDATVDWPGCTFWREISRAHPDALVLLSTRHTSEEWWASISTTILPEMTKPVPNDQPEWAARRVMMLDVLERTLGPSWATRDGAVSGYERHNAAVRESVPADRLIDWTCGDGWEPLCAALGVAVPDRPFPHTNTGEEFRARANA